jgi:putative methyltransferase (TIGR04325 family)
MYKIPDPLKHRAKALLELMPAGRDVYLLIAKRRIGISYRGVFQDAVTARNAIPPAKKNDYDVINRRKAENEAQEKERLENWFHTEDYPLLFWLSRLLHEPSSVLELGGSVGHFFYSMQRYYPCGAGIRWTIAELPEAVKLGRKLAVERGETHLSFVESNEIARQPAADIFLTAGTVQYMETPLPELLQSLTTLPSHVLVHNLPTHADRSYWTLQQLPLCEVAYRIYSRRDLVAGMQALGYSLVADWNKARTVEIPFHRDLEVEGYCGFYFSR